MLQPLCRLDGHFATNHAWKQQRIRKKYEEQFGGFTQSCRSRGRRAKARKMFRKTTIEFVYADWPGMECGDLSPLSSNLFAR